MTFQSLAIPKHHGSLVGIDSDGCVFDSMEQKQRDYFMPSIIGTWGLEHWADTVRDHVARINLYSSSRGGNRFPNLILLFESLAADPAIAKQARLPDLTALKAYCHSGVALGNPSLVEYVAKHPSPELERVLRWSLDLSHAIDTTMPPPRPFEWARIALETMALTSDLVVISQTPQNALNREWGHYGFDKLVAAIAGQEHGTKTAQLQKAGAGRYRNETTLMIGDALGDLLAARDCDACFYPIVPGDEEASWKELCERGYGYFHNGSYKGRYENQQIARFRQKLN